MKFAATFHHAQNWYMFPTDDSRYDCADPRYRDLYTGPHGAAERPDEWFPDRWEGKPVRGGRRLSARPDLVRLRPRLHPRAAPQAFLAYYYNKEREWGRGVVVTFKEIPTGWFNLPPMTGVADLERGRMWDLTNHVWLTDTTVDCPRCVVVRRGRRLQVGGTPGAQSWWTGSARTGTCCSTSARGLTAPFPGRQRSACAASAAGWR